MTETEIRNKFEAKLNKGFDLTKAETWGGIQYIHPHIESMWYGFRMAHENIEKEEDLLAGAVLMSAQEDGQ